MDGSLAGHARSPKRKSEPTEEVEARRVRPRPAPEPKFGKGDKVRLRKQYAQRYHRKLQGELVVVEGTSLGVAVKVRGAGRVTDWIDMEHLERRKK